MTQTPPIIPTPIYMHRTDRADERRVHPLRQSINVAVAATILARHGRADLAGPLHESLSASQAQRLGQKIQRFVEKAGRHAGFFARYRSHPMPEAHQRTLMLVAGWLRDVGRAGCETFVPEVNVRAIAEPVASEATPPRRATRRASTTAIPPLPSTSTSRVDTATRTVNAVPVTAALFTEGEAAIPPTVDARATGDGARATIPPEESGPPRDVAVPAHAPVPGDVAAPTAAIDTEDSGPNLDERRVRNAKEVSSIMDDILADADTAATPATPSAMTDDDAEGPSSPPWVDAAAYGSLAATGTDD